MARKVRETPSPRALGRYALDTLGKATADHTAALTEAVTLYTQADPAKADAFSGYVKVSAPIIRKLDKRPLPDRQAFVRPLYRAMLPFLSRPMSYEQATSLMRAIFAKSAILGQRLGVMAPKDSDNGAGGGRLLLTSRAADGLGYPKGSRVRQFLADLEAQFLRLHPQSGEAWLSWYHEVAKTILHHIDREPMLIQRKLYNYIFRTVIAPTGPSLEPAEVDKTIVNLRKAWTTLAVYYKEGKVLPPPPPPEDAGRQRMTEASAVAEATAPPTPAGPEALPQPAPTALPPMPTPSPAMPASLPRTLAGAM